MFIADTHCDTLFAMGVHGVPAERLMVTPERIRAGGVSLQALALWTGPKGGRGDVAGIVRKELDALPALLAGGLRRVDDPSEAVGSPVPCVMLSVEGGEVFEDGPDSVDRYRALGVRMAALLWNHENALGYPAKSGSSHGLKPYGLETVRRMQAAGMAVDTSHLNEAGFWDILEKTDVPPLASHSCCKALCNHFRNLTDDQIRALIDRRQFLPRLPQRGRQRRRRPRGRAHRSHLPAGRSRHRGLRLRLRRHRGDPRGPASRRRGAQPD